MTISEYVRLKMQADIKNRRVAEAAKAFVWHFETWEHYQDMKGSISMDLPVELMTLCEAVEEEFGEPIKELSNGDEVVIKGAEITMATNEVVNNDSMEKISDDILHLLDGLELDGNGRIISAGKFENCTPAVPYYHYWVMEGSSDHTVYDGGKVYDYLIIKDEDIEILEKIAPTHDFRWLKKQLGNYFRIFTDDSGFVHGAICTDEELASHIEDAEKISDGD